MAITAEPGLHGEVHEDKKIADWIIGGSLGEAVAAGFAITLAIIGLADMMPITMASITTIALGISLLFQGGAVASRFSALISESTQGEMDLTDFGEGVSVEFIAGTCGITLGILSLLDIVPFILLPIAAIVFGGALILATGVNVRLNAIRITRTTDSEMARKIAREMVMAASGVQLLIGLGAIILGILGILEIETITLCLIAFLSLGFSAFLSSTAVTARMIGAFHRY